MSGLPKLTPAVSACLTQLLTRLELFKKTDIAELDNKQRNGIHNVRAKAKALLDSEIPLSTAVPITAALMNVWAARQNQYVQNLPAVYEPDENVEKTQNADLNELEDKAFYKTLNDMSTASKLKDVHQLFGLVNQICDTLMKQQAELRQLKSQNKTHVNDNNLITSLRQYANEDLSAPSVSGRVWVDCIINQTDNPLPVSPLFSKKAASDQNVDRQHHTGEEVNRTPIANTTIYQNVVSFEASNTQDEEEDKEVMLAPFLEDDLFANPSILRPVGRVHFNTQKELHESAILGFGGNDPPPPPPTTASRKEGVPLIKSNAAARRRMSINTRLQASMDQIGDELMGLNEW